MLALGPFTRRFSDAHNFKKQTSLPSLNRVVSIYEVLQSPQDCHGNVRGVSIQTVGLICPKHSVCPGNQRPTITASLFLSLSPHLQILPKMELSTARQKTPLFPPLCGMSMKAPKPLTHLPSFFTYLETSQYILWLLDCTAIILFGLYLLLWLF